MNRNRVAVGCGSGLLAVVAMVFGGIYAMATSQPGPQDLPMPAGAVALGTAPGDALLEGAARADHAGLLQSFQTQEQGAWCGVASSAAVINAAKDPDITQNGLFTPEAEQVRGWWKTTFGGMTISDLAGMVRAHGLQAVPHHAEDSDVEAFRAEARRNLSTSGDWLIVNYDRKKVGEKGGGHISPVSALSADGQHILVLDTASYKYPPHWVSVDALFAAMNTPDSESGRSRGWVVVSTPERRK